MELWLLRVIHVPAAVFWGGFAAFIGLYLLPALFEAGPAGGAVMAGIVKRKITLVMNVLGALTLLSGLRLYSIYYSGEWFISGAGMALTLGALFAIIALVVGVTISRPAAARLGALGATLKAAGGPPGAAQVAELAALQARAGRAGKVNAVCVIGAAVCMGASRFFPL